MDATVEIELKHHGEAIDDLKVQDEKQWVELDRIKAALTRLVPVWVTVIVSTMSFLTGSALTIAVIAVKYSGK